MRLGEFGIGMENGLRSGARDWRDTGQSQERVPAVSGAAKLYGLLVQVAREPARGGAELHHDSLLGDLALAIGAGAAARLARAYGGRRVYIPATPSARDQISRSIGLEAAVRLARLYGGSRVMIPADPERALRRARIVAMRRNGWSVSAIARAAGVSERYVYKVLAASRNA
jgi:Mor family transcriptional regulator